MTIKTLAVAVSVLVVSSALAAEKPSYRTKVKIGDEEVEPKFTTRAVGVPINSGTKAQRP